MGYVAAILIGALLALGGYLLITRRRNGIVTKSDLDRISRQASLDKVDVDIATQVAVAEVERIHADEIERLNDEQRAEAAKLRDDPSALAGFLIDVGNS